MAFQPSDYGDRVVLGGGDMALLLGRVTGATGQRWEQACLHDAWRFDEERQQVVSDQVSEFIRAGAELLIAPTDRLSVLALEARWAGSCVDPAGPADLARRVIETFRRAASTHAGVRVLAALGPTDRLLALDEVEPDTLTKAYALAASTALEAGADGVLCRSFVELPALVLAVDACTEATGLPVVACMTFDSGPDFTHTRMGVTIPQACAELQSRGVAAIGCDGSEFPDGAPAVATLFRESTSLPVWIEVNAGRAELLDGALVYPELPRAFGERLRNLADLDVRFVCGGAGVTAQHLSEMQHVRQIIERKRGRPGA